MEHVDQVGRGRAARLFQVFFQGVHQGRKVGQSHAAGRSLERVEAPPQLPQRLPGVGVAAEAQHQRLDPLEQVRGVGEKGLADFLIEINLLGQCGNRKCWNDLVRLNLGGRSRRHCEDWRNRIRPNLDGRSHRHRDRGRTRARSTGSVACRTCLEEPDQGLGIDPQRGVSIGLEAGIERLEPGAAVLVFSFLAFEQGKVFSPGRCGVIKDPVHDAVIAVVTWLVAPGKLGQGLRTEEPDLVRPVFRIGRETFPDLRQEADAAQSARPPNHSSVLGLRPQILDCLSDVGKLAQR